MRVFLADLGHNQLTLSSDVYPLGVANLATYARAYFSGPEPLEIQSRVVTFGEHPAGLGKFTRTMFANDLRRTLVHARTYVEATKGVC